MLGSLALVAFAVPLHAVARPQAAAVTSVASSTMQTRAQAHASAPAKPSPAAPKPPSTGATPPAKPASATPTTTSTGATTPTSTSDTTAPADTAADTGDDDDVTRYTFTGLDIDGELRTPALLQFLARIGGEFETVGIPHRSFMPELASTTSEDAL
jgi:hypothetical protein